MPTVSALSIAPVKGLGLEHPDEIVLERHGVAENRRFYLVDRHGQRFAGKECGPLVQVAAEYDAAAERLALRFPDGIVVEGTVRLGERIETDFWGRPVGARLVEGPWAGPLSEFAGRPVRLAKTDEPGAGVDRGSGRGPISLISEASLDELTRAAGADARVDWRRFRMLVVVAGCGPHEEDEWIASVVRIGEAAVRFLGPVGRCVVTTRDPDTGERDLDTLRVIGGYRGRSLATGGFDFGVYGAVVDPGRVRVGDPVEPQPYGSG
jgi:uncharacterized protein YcbX